MMRTYRPFHNQGPKEFYEKRKAVRVVLWTSLRNRFLSHNQA